MKYARRISPPAGNIILALLLSWSFNSGNDSTVPYCEARIFPFSKPWGVQDTRGGSTIASETFKPKSRFASRRKTTSPSILTPTGSTASTNGATSLSSSSTTNSTESYVAVTTLIWGGDDKSVRSRVPTSDQKDLEFLPGCQLRISNRISNNNDNNNDNDTKDWIGRGVWSRNTAALWKSTAFLSDVTVVVLDSRDPLDPLLVQALQAGLAARHADSALPKGHLLVVLNTSDKESPGVLNAWKQRLALSDLSSLFSHKFLDTFQIIPAYQYEQTMAELMKDKNQGGVCRMADTNTFPSLLRQVHRAFGGGNIALLQPQKQPLLRTVDRRPAPSRKKSSNDPSTSSSTTISARETEALLEARILDSAHQQLDELQRQLEDAWLDNANAAGSGGALPLNFAARANPILARLERPLRSSKLPATVRASVKVQVGTRVRQLYQQHLQSLRDYYGRLYEVMVDRAAAAPTDPEAWRDAATRVTERFRQATAAAVPHLAQPGKLFDGADLESAAALSESGLVADMMEAMMQREEEDLEQQVELETVAAASSSSTVTVHQKKIRTWHKKLAARALVFAVNYLQGWLAWQGVKRAALEREQQMPKFPLF